MIVTMHMDSLEWECQEVEWHPEIPAYPEEKATFPPDLSDADIDAFLRRMYALQQC